MLTVSDNWKGLHNLDLVAHHILIDRSHFQENTIPYNAKELAARLSKALAGLFSRSDNERAGLPFQRHGPGYRVFFVPRLLLLWAPVPVVGPLSGQVGR